MRHVFRTPDTLTIELDGRGDARAMFTHKLETAGDIDAIARKITMSEAMEIQRMIAAGARGIALESPSRGTINTCEWERESMSDEAARMVPPAGGSYKVAMGRWA